MKGSRFLCVALLVCAAIVTVLVYRFGHHDRGTTVPGSSAATRSSVAPPAPGSRPLAFEKNVGQLDAAVKFVTRGAGYQLFFTPDGATWALQSGHADRDDRPRVDVLRMRLVDGNADALVTGTAAHGARAHYFRGRRPADWRTNIPTFQRVHYAQVYPGIDLEYYGRDGRLEYDFIVAPGVDPAVIAMEFEGADRVSIDHAGALVIEIAGGHLLQERPFVYQQVRGVRRTIESSYVVTANNEIGFSLGPYDSREPLVIDPVLSYSTFVGGTGGAFGDQAYGVAVDTDDNIYVTGKTVSTVFPVQQGQPANNDLFVLKMTPEGALVYAAVVNGNGSDSGEGIAVDGSGNAVITGFTDSTDFPTLNPIHLDRPARDAFLLKLDPSGVIVYSTYLGGDSGFDYGEAVAVDGDGNAYVTGTTQSVNFPVLNGVLPTLRGQDAFAVKVDASGNLLYATFLGGSSTEAAESIAVDATGSFYVTGWTKSTNFPRVQSTVGKASGEDVFVSRFLPDGSGFVYSRYLGGNSDERPYAITVDGTGGVYVGGRTDSTNFPSVLPLHGDRIGSDAFLTRLGSTGVVSFSTYLGGSLFERILGLGVRDGRLFVTGQTFSTDFPVFDAVQPVKAGDTTTADAFVVTLDVGLSTLVSSTYLGGTRNEEGRGVAALPGYNVFVVGWTESTDFPTVRAIQDFKSNVNNAFITRIAPIGVTAISPAFALNTSSTAVTITGQDFLPGAGVRVGGASATGVVVVDAFTITATLPPLGITGDVDVTVTNPDGGGGTLYRGLKLLDSTGPVANAGPDQSVEATSVSGAAVVLDGSGSYDPDNEPMTFEWRDANNNVLGAGVTTTITVPIGVQTITLIVSDGHSSPATDTLSVSVVDTTAPAVALASPNGSNKIYTGTPTFIEWTASDVGAGIASFDVYLSTNGGSSYDTTPICAGVPGTATSCVWTGPAPVTGKARVRVTARDAAGNVASDASNGNFSIASGTASVRVTSPNMRVNWGAGSTQQIKWNHNLGTAAYTRLDFSVDGGINWTPIDTVRNSAGSSGVYNWIVPGVLSTAARIRATWAHGPVSDQSDVSFTIATAFIQVTPPGTGVNWGYGTTRNQTWTTNLGPFDRVDLQLLTDVAPPLELSPSIVATAGTATFDTPTLAMPTAAAAVRIVWANAPAGFSAEGVSTGTFRVEPPFLIVTVPNGGEIWTVGSNRNITWSSNLGGLERVNVELSLDDGATFPNLVLSGTPSDGAQVITLSSSWLTTQGRIRITWIDSPSVTDTSDNGFVIR